MQRLWKNRCLFISVLLVFTLCLGGCNKITKESRILKVGVRSNIVNLGYLNEKTGNYYGLEIDIANEMAKRMGYSGVEFIEVIPDNRKQMLLDGKVDCLVAAYTISDTRLENFDFSPAYYTDSLKVMVEKSTMFTTLTDLKYKNIGILSGTDAGPLLAQKMLEIGMINEKVLSNDDNGTVYNNVKVTKAQSYEELYEMLNEGTIDAVCLDNSIAATYMNEDCAFLDTVISESEYGVATQKGSELSQETSKAIQEMLDDGTIGRLINKWN